jgi:hypothetical protein
VSERWHRLEAIYHDALARPADERAAFVAAACAGDVALEQEFISSLPMRRPPRRFSSARRAGLVAPANKFASP